MSGSRRYRPPGPVRTAASGTARRSIPPRPAPTKNVSCRMRSSFRLVFDRDGQYAVGGVRAVRETDREIDDRQVRRFTRRLGIVRERRVRDGGRVLGRVFELDMPAGRGGKIQMGLP